MQNGIVNSNREIARRVATITALWFCVSVAANNANADEAAGDRPPVVEVEGQPLAANVSRLIDAMQAIGSPLPSAEVESLRDAGRARDSQRLQELLDPHVLFVVHINPESRVKVKRGPAAVELQQFGFTPILIKVMNDSTATKRLRIVSPQGKAVYAGTAKLSMQRQQQSEFLKDQADESHPERFLSVALHDQPPMTDRLSGLEVEYAIGLILCTESGKREATIGFDLGGGEQDLGSRGETPVLFSVKPAIPVRLSVRDFDGTPTTAALLIRDRLGRVYPPQAKRLAPDFFFQPQIYRADGETVLLPPGEFTVQSGRGPEYWVRERPLRVTAGSENKLDVQLERWVNPREFGFYSGDHHIHAAGCAHYTSPTEGVLPEDMFRQVKGEGLNVGCVLTWGPCYRYQRQFFAARPHDVSEPLTLLKYDLEISGFGSQALGHVCLLNLQDQTYPGSEGTETQGWPLWTTPVMRWAKAQGGVTGYAHSASGLGIDPAPAAKRLLAKWDADNDGILSRDETDAALLPESFAAIDSTGDGVLDERELTASHDRAADRLPNLAIPEMNGVGAMEICVTTAEGVCDFISAMDTQRIQEWNTWYHILNCGFPLKVSGETDFPCMSSRRVGQGRVYVQLDCGPRTSLVPSPPPSGERVRVRGPNGENASDSNRSPSENESESKLHEGRTPHPNPLPSKARGEGTGKEPLTLSPDHRNGGARRGEGTKRLDFTAWCEGLAKGRSYVSDGFAHALDFRVSEVAPGFGDVELAEKGSVSVTAKVAFASETPETVAQGTVVPRAGQRLLGDTVELHGPRSDKLVAGGERLIEIVVNGRVVASQKVPADGQPHDLKFDVAVDRSSWIALRQFPQLHTNPVNVIVGDRPIRASRDSARWCDEVIELLWKNRHKVIPETEREEAFRTFEKARETYRKIAAESDVP